VLFSSTPRTMSWLDSCFCTEEEMLACLGLDEPEVDESNTPSNEFSGNASFNLFTFCHGGL
jgi:hypothetical protein